MRILRLATKEDCDLVYGWANDPVTRAMSFNTEPIPYENHVVWYGKLMDEMYPGSDQTMEKDNLPFSRRLLIFMDGETPVAQMRLDVEKNVPEADSDMDRSSETRDTFVCEIELSYSVAPQFRGQGLGRELIAETLGYIKGVEFPGKISVLAQVKEDNPGSQKMLLANGFELSGKNEDGSLRLSYSFE